MKLKRSKKELNNLYGIKSVTSGSFGEGFYDALNFFDNRLNEFFGKKSLEFYDYCKSEVKK